MCAYGFTFSAYTQAQYGTSPAQAQHAGSHQRLAQTKRFPGKAPGRNGHRGSHCTSHRRQDGIQIRRCRLNASPAQTQQKAPRKQTIQDRREQKKQGGFDNAKTVSVDQA